MLSDPDLALPAAVLAQRTLQRTPCMWDLCEALLKASLQPKEDGVLAAWVRGWTTSMSCFPRLHVITDPVPRAKRFFEGVPNVTYRRNELPPRIAEYPTPYALVQIHLMWADNVRAPT